MTTRPPVQINVNFNPHDSDTESDPEGLFPSNDSDPDEFGLQRALPSNKLTWDNVRKYSNIITSRPDILMGLTAPPPATFFDSEQPTKRQLNTQTPSNQVSTLNKNLFQKDNNKNNENNNSMSKDSTILSPSSSGPRDIQTTDIPPQRPLERTRRNTLRASTQALCKQNDTGPLALLRQNSQQSVTSLQNPTTLPQQQQPQSHFATHVVPGAGLDVEDDEHEFVNQMLKNKNGRRASATGFDVDMNIAASLPPPPTDDNKQTNNNNNNSQQKPSDSITGLIITDVDAPPPPTTGKRVFFSPVEIVPPQQKPTNPNHSEGDMPLPTHLTTKPNRRNRNLSRTEEDLMQLYVKQHENKVTSTPQKLQPQPQPKQQPQPIVQDDIPPPPPQDFPLPFEMPPKPNESNEQQEIRQQHDQHTIEHTSQHNISDITSQTSLALQIAHPQDLYDLYKKCMNILDANELAQNDPAIGLYSIPDLYSLVQLGVILSFGLYSPDTFVNENVTTPTQQTNRYLKLQPTTYSNTKFIDNHYIKAHITSSSLYSGFSHHINSSIIHIPFDVPVDIHPRSFGVSLLLTAATVQISLIPTDLNHHYQQCAVFFLSLALILQHGVTYSPNSLISYESNIHTTLTTPTQEDVLFYLSLLVDPMDYQRLYNLYTMNHPRTLMQQQLQASPLEQRPSTSFANYHSKKELTALCYSILPQIEHQAGLRFYQLAPTVEQAYSSYYALLNTTPPHKQSTIPKPSFLTTCDCYIVGYMLWLKASVQSYAPAIADTSWSRYSGSGIEKSFQLAFHWVYLAARLGDPRAMNNLGLYYKKGIGGFSVDLPRCYYWLQKSKMANCPSLSTKTLEVVTKQLNLIGVEPRDNPYLDPIYGQLPEGTTLDPVDDWETWIINCETYNNNNYDVTTTTGLYSQKQRVDIQLQITTQRLHKFPPLIHQQYYGQDIVYNAAVILAMIPRSIVIAPTPRRASIGTSQARPMTPLPKLPPTPLQITQAEDITQSRISPTAMKMSLPPIPQELMQQQTQSQSHSEPQQQQPFQSQFTMNNNPRRPSAFARKTSIDTLSRPQTYTLSKEDITQLQQQQSSLHQDYQFHQQHSIPLQQQQTGHKTPIKPNYNRILSAGQQSTTFDDDGNISFTFAAQHQQQQQQIDKAQSLPTLSRLDSTSGVDPIAAQRQKQLVAREQAEQKYHQQDAIPPPPPPAEDYIEEGDENDPYQNFPQQLRTIPADQIKKESSNSNGVTTFNPTTNTYIHEQNRTIVNTAPTPYSKRPSVVGVAAPQQIPITPTTPRNMPNTITTTTPTSSPQQSLPSLIAKQSLPPPVQQQSLHTSTIPEHDDNVSFGRTSASPSMSALSTTPAAHHNYTPMSPMSTGRRSVTSLDSRLSQGSIVMVSATPIERNPTMTDQEWKKACISHYRHTLAKMMNLTRDGYVTRLDHLNGLAELRVAYNITQEEHQTQYHFCKQLFDQREEQEKQRFKMIVDRKKSISTMQKTIKLEQYEKELLEHKKKMQDSSAQTPKNHGTCLQCKINTASQCILPCGHYCLCQNCALGKIKKCLYCGGVVKSIAADPNAK